MATIFWLKFTDGTFGSCGGNGYEEAKAKAEDVSGKPVESGQQLPYFANPIIWQPTHEKYGKSPAFCHRPKQCAGRGSCPQSRSCTD